MKQALEERMRGYEDVYRNTLTPHSYTVLRIDGRAFHTYTRQLPRPFSTRLAEMLDGAAIAVCEDAMNCRFAYGQSDEYSFLLNDTCLDSQQWFGGVVQKIASVAASVFTVGFNHHVIINKLAPVGVAQFDARVFVLPNAEEVVNYFIYRQIDCETNSLSMLAREHFSHKQLLGKNSSDMHGMLHEVGVNWNDCPAQQKRGRIIKKDKRERLVTFTHKRTRGQETRLIEESCWVVDREVPRFSQDRLYLEQII